MTRIVLPGMLKRKFGYILNVGSFAGLLPIPILSVYSSTKAFLRFFSEALQKEYTSDGIIFKCISPMMVSTNMVRNAKPSVSIPTAERFVSDTFRNMSSSVTYSPYWFHNLSTFLCLSFPVRFVIALLYNRNIRVADQLRSRILKNK